jgi:hypothetical protein
VALLGATYSFLSRPSLDVKPPPIQISTEADTPRLSGQLTCRVEPELSRVTVSSTDDLPINWDNSGCMNGKTQYVDVAGRWSRVLVPNGSETAYVQEFDPDKGEYVSTRYLLPQSEMERLREIRGASSEKKCASDQATLSELTQLTEALKASLPTQPNERIVYRCSVAPKM